MHAHRDFGDIEKSEFYEMGAEAFYFLVFFFFFDDKIVIKRKTKWYMGETVPYITDISGGTRVVKWNINGDYSDYLFINITSGYREELWKIKSKTFIYN